MCSRCDNRITEHQFQKECEEIAKEVFEEFMDDNPYEDAGYYRDDMDDRVHEGVDGHPWVIWNHRALQIVCDVDVRNGEEFLDDVGLPSEPTIYSIACSIVYGEMRFRVMEEINRLIEEWVPKEEGEPVPLSWSDLTDDDLLANARVLASWKDDPSLAGLCEDFLNAVAEDEYGLSAREALVEYIETTYPEETA